MLFAQRNKQLTDSITQHLEIEKSDSLLVRHHIELGILKDRIQPKKAESHLKTALNILKSDYLFSDKQTQTALANDCLGIIERRRNNYDIAFEYYLRALKIKEAINDTLLIGRSYHNIAMLFSAKRDYNKAINYMQKALPMRYKTDSVSYAVSLNNLGYFYYKKESYISALTILDSAKLFYGTSWKLTDANKNISKIYLKQKRYNEAFTIQQNSLKIYRAHEKTERIANILKDLAITSRKLKRYSLANTFLDESERIAYTYNNKKLIAILYKERYRIAQSKKDYKTALKHYRSYKKYEDSLNLSFQAENIRQLELNYNNRKTAITDSINYANKNMKLFIEAKSERFQKRLYISLLILALTILTGIYFLYRYKRKSYYQSIQKQELEATLQNEKIEFLRFRIDGLLVDNRMRTSFNEELSRQIKSLQNRKNSNELITEYQSVLVQLKNQISTEKRLDNVSETINKTDLVFDLKLAEKYPELTKSEREVCHLIYLNLSSKEIINVRNISLSSIKSIRFRIRKKLAIPKGIELGLFIQKLFENK